MPNPTAEELIQIWDRNARKLAARSSHLGDINKEVLITPRILNLIEPYPSQESLERYPTLKDDLRMCHFTIVDLEKD